MQCTRNFVLTTMLLLLLAPVSSTPAQQSVRPGTSPQDIKRGDIKIKKPPEQLKQRNTYKNLKPGSPEAVRNRGLAQERQRKMAEFNRRFRLEAQREIKVLNQKLLAAQNQAFQRQVKQVRVQFDQARATAKEADMRRSSMMKQLEMAPTKPQPRLKPVKPGARVAPIKSQQGQTTIKPGTIDPSQVALKMEVTRIFSLIPKLTDNAVKEGQLVFITGKNFILLPQVWLEYKGTRPEFSNVTPQYKRKLSVKRITDTAIYARVPMLPEKDVAYVDGTLVIAGSAQQIIKKQVSLTATAPGITLSLSAPFYGQDRTTLTAVMGGTMAIVGKDFGDKPGKIFLELSHPVNGKKHINLLPATGNWANDWTNNAINVKIPKEPGNHAYQTATLHIWTNYNEKMSATVDYGPRMVVTVVSGEDFAQIAMKRKTDIEEASNVLKVTHDPDCSGWFDSGPEGRDWFFKNPTLPENCKLLDAVFQQINPDDPTWSYLKGILENLAETLIDGFSYEFFTEGVGKVWIGGIATSIDPSAGQYVCRIHKNKDGTVCVRWFTTCAFYAPYEDVPVSYIIAFRLVGPEGVVPGSK